MATFATRLARSQLTRKLRHGAALAAILAAGATLALAAYGSGGEVGVTPSVIKLANFQPAIAAIGQFNLVSGSPNRGFSGPMDFTLRHPVGDAAVASSSGELFLADESNNRVLGYATIPTESDYSAVLVLGQANFTSAGSGDAADQMNIPTETVISSDGKLLVDDDLNNRVLIWNTVPTTNDTPADVVVGQAAFGTHGAACSSTGMDNPEGIAVTPDGKLIVADSNNNRVLIFNHIPTSNGAAPDLILGQNNSTTCVKDNDGTGASGSPSASNFNLATGVWSDGKRLVVLDTDNNRVLIWNTYPTSSFQPAHVVLGQTDFTSDVFNNNGSGFTGAPSAQNMHSPTAGVFSNGVQLFVADEENNRVLVWNTFPTTNFQKADAVLGQPDFTCNAKDSSPTGDCTTGPLSAYGLFFPSGVFQEGNYLVVTDSDENRALVYQEFSECVATTPKPTVPAPTPTPLPGHPVITSVSSPILVGGDFTLKGSNFTKGSEINFFISTATGPLNVGPLKPDATKSTTTVLEVPVPASVPLGQGFASVEVVNTDQKFAASNLGYALLEGWPAAGLPTITEISGHGLAATSIDPGFATANVETTLTPGNPVGLTGTGFDVVNGVAVDVFCACPGGKLPTTFIAAGDADLTSDRIKLNIPADAPTGPGSIVVSNAGSTHSYAAKSEAVSVPIGARIKIDEIAQSGTTMTVTGSGFSTLTVINFFNAQSGKVFNLGGLKPGGVPEIPLTLVNSNKFTFTVPAGAMAGPAFIQALNPPFLPFTSSGDDPCAGFTLK